MWVWQYKVNSVVLWVCWSNPILEGFFLGSTKRVPGICQLDIWSAVCLFWKIMWCFFCVAVSTNDSVDKQEKLQKKYDIFRWQLQIDFFTPERKFFFSSMQCATVRLPTKILQSMKTKRGFCLKRSFFSIKHSTPCFV